MKRSWILGLGLIVSALSRADAQTDYYDRIKAILAKNVCQVIVINHCADSTHSEGYTNSTNTSEARVIRVIPIHEELLQASGVIEVNNIVAVRAEQRASFFRVWKHGVEDNVLKITFENPSHERNEASGKVEIVERKKTNGDQVADNVLDLVQFPVTPLANLKVMIENTGNVKYWNRFPSNLSFTLVCQER